MKLYLYKMIKSKKKKIKKDKPKKIGLLLNKVYDNFKKKQKNDEKKELKHRADQIKKGNEKNKLKEKE